MPLKFRVNGVEYSLEVEPHERLCDVLRNRLGLMSVKTGCGSGTAASAQSWLTENLLPHA
jgi:aerobic-type carbon monoxide dehydrogenase small subunit (CoxS/CutS family)